MALEEGARSCLMRFRHRLEDDIKPPYLMDHMVTDGVLTGDEEERIKNQVSLSFRWEGEGVIHDFAHCYVHILTSRMVLWAFPRLGLWEFSYIYLETVSVLRIQSLYCFRDYSELSYFYLKAFSVLSMANHTCLQQLNFPK